jgi:murein DD-endopeptidase MepM/ murein hydrolase activator NlpD
MLTPKLLLIIPFLGLIVLNSCDHNPSKVKVIDMGLKVASVGTATVENGDSISLIADRYEVPLESLIVANKLNPPYTIYPTQRLILPPPRTYTVQNGDTIYEISRMFSTTQTSLVRRNNIQKPYQIRTGQVLKLPMPQRMSQQTHVKQPKSVQKLKRRVVKKAPQFSGNGAFSIPVKGKIISSYGPKDGGLHNDGINISAPRGSQVNVAQNGVVAYVGDGIEGYGNLVLVRHDKGYITAYAHLDSVTVSRDTVLNKGQKIGTVGATGNVESPQLHFEIRKGTKALNPATLL